MHVDVVLCVDPSYELDNLYLSSKKVCGLKCTMARGGSGGNAYQPGESEEEWSWQCVQHRLPTLNA